MERIIFTTVLHKNVDGADTRFCCMSGPLTNNYLEKWLGVIIRGTYQSGSEDSRWAYEPLSDLWLDIYTDSDSSDGGSSEELRKYQYNPDYQEQKEVISVPRKNPRRLRQDDKWTLQMLKIDIENSNDKLFFIKNTEPQDHNGLNDIWYRWTWTNHMPVVHKTPRGL